LPAAASSLALLRLKERHAASSAAAIATTPLATIAPIALLLRDFFLRDFLLGAFGLEPHAGSEDASSQLGGSMLVGAGGGGVFSLAARSCCTMASAPSAMDAISDIVLICHADCSWVFSM
jgi:hypothetical protein